jgi:hypothetical protein
MEFILSFLFWSHVSLTSEKSSLPIKLTRSNKVFESLHSGNRSALELSGAEKQKKDDRDYYFYKEYPGCSSTFYSHSSRYEIGIYDCKNPDDKKAIQHKAERFFWISSLFNTSLYHKEYLFNFWENQERIEEIFKTEKDKLETDEHTLLYWILHFGLLKDERYPEVKAKISHFNSRLLNDAVLLVDAMENGKNTIKNMDDSVRQEYYENIFITGLKHSYGPTFISYKNSDEGNNKKAYWMVKKAHQNNTWDRLHEDLKEVAPDKKALPYILANNPKISLKEQQKNAEKYLHEMKANFERYSEAINAFTSIFNIHQKVEDKKLLAEVTPLFFNKIIARQFHPEVVDEFNEIVEHLQQNGIKNIEKYEAQAETVLEKFDHQGYKQVQFSLFQNRATVSAFLNGDNIHSSILEKYDQKNHKNSYQKFIKIYQDMGFQEVESLGILSDKITPEERPKILAQRMSFNKFRRKNTDFYMEEVWWKNYQVDVYPDDFLAEGDIDLNNEEYDFFNDSGLIFLKNLEVEGDILNPVLEYGRPIFVGGETKAHSVSAGGAYLHFDGGLEVQNTLVPHYNDGCITIRKFLKANVFFDDSDHCTYAPQKLDINFYYTDNQFFGENGNPGIEKNIRTKDLLTLKDEAWLSVEDIDYSACKGLKNKKQKRRCMDEELESYAYVFFSDIASEDLHNFSEKIRNIFDSPPSKK